MRKDVISMYVSLSWNMMSECDKGFYFCGIFVVVLMTPQTNVLAYFHSDWWE